MAHLHHPRRPSNDAPDVPEPGAPPIEPDEGPIPAPMGDDPGHDRSVGPAANLRADRAEGGAPCR